MPSVGGGFSRLESLDGSNLNWRVIDSQHLEYYDVRLDEPDREGLSGNRKLNAQRLTLASEARKSVCIFISVAGKFGRPNLMLFTRESRVELDRLPGANTGGRFWPCVQPLCCIEIPRFEPTFRLNPRIVS